MKDKNPVNVLALIIIAASLLVCSTSEAGNADESLLYPAKQLGAITTLMNSIPDIIFYKDLDGIYRGGNKAWAALAGKPLDQLIGKTDLDLFPMELATLFRAKDREMLASKETRRNEEWGCCQHMCVDLMMGLWGWIPGRCMSLLAKIAACS